ncbi:AAA family ATPase [Rugamonas rubra]|uniref:ATPase family associated with various cellular activities (AAA) n=1 Tax=Rugamonas rubra TaxID=758825 RepID=A0A1I4UVU4_9BURK|nr:ATP-binding protein [Rugamonas rubra]SFM93028.1 ATPase family associated with various cellular activities (AAA) [Rugamonas rubra]
MANGDQIKAMLRAYKDADEHQLLTLALQIAAREAKAGHNRLAGEIRDLVEQLKAHGPIVPKRQATPIVQPKGELADLVSVDYPDVRLDDLVLLPEVRHRLDRMMREQRQAGKIREFGLNPRGKLLFVGPPGTGKTMSAKAVAAELSLPLFTLRLESLFTRFMGEAAAKLKLIFENIQQVRGVYLFDEFDAIGQQRAAANDVGEIRRILNSFLQLVEQDQSNSVVIAATNHPELLDNALFRRFDDVLRFEMPSRDSLVELLKRRLARNAKSLDYEVLAAEASGLSYADIQRACDDALKDMIIVAHDHIAMHDMQLAIRERGDDRKTFSNPL